MSYLKFVGMITVSTLVMYGLMYLNTFELDHALWSQTRAWMALLMGAAMSVIMLGFMLSMYKNRQANIAIMGVSLVVFTLALYLVRSQALVGDRDWMMAMIPHHSIAILTSTNAKLSDPRVRDLAARIVDTQVREINEMKELLRNVPN